MNQSQRADGGRSLWPWALLLILITFAAYLPAVWAEFLLHTDDDEYLIKNYLLTMPGGFRRIWTAPMENIQYYPLTFTVLWLERRLFGLSPLGYHVLNVALHAFNAVLVWLLLKKMGAKRGWVAAAIFALHPVHVESVAFITELKNVMSGTFFLLAAGAYLRFMDDERRARWYWAAFGLFLLSLLSKTVTCTLPFVLLLLRWHRGLRVGWRDAVRLWPFFAAAVAIGLVTMRVEAIQGHYYTLTFFQRPLLAGRALWFYAGKLAWPSDLVFNYERWKLDAADWTQWSWAAGALAVMAAAWRRRRRGPVLALGFFVISLSPMLGFFHIAFFRYSFVADHFQYLASIGLIALGAEGLSYLGGKKVQAAVAGILLACLGWASWSQAGIYQNSAALWGDTLRKNPNSQVAHTVFAQFAEFKRDWALAVKHYREALRIDPEFAEAHNNLGLVLTRQGKTREAIEEFHRALKIHPDGAETYNNLGFALAKQGDYAEAVDHYQTAIKLSLAGMQVTGRRQSVVFGAARYNMVVALERQNAVTFLKAADILRRNGHAAQAAAYYGEALRINPDLEAARRGLAAARRATAR